tara:strand:- start:400 stop:720 length:321 start_codon:yes stop_codon:yes gene_type:complete
MSKEEDKYVIMDEDVTIGCPDHGDFLATPFEHIKGYGCPVCRHEEVMKLLKQINDRLDYCIEHECNAADNHTPIQADSYSKIIHEMYGKTRKMLDEFIEVRGKIKV